MIFWCLRIYRVVTDTDYLLLRLTLASPWMPSLFAAPRIGQPSQHLLLEDGKPGRLGSRALDILIALALAPDITTATVNGRQPNYRARPDSPSMRASLVGRRALVGELTTPPAGGWGLRSPLA